MLDPEDPFNIVLQQLSSSVSTVGTLRPPLDVASSVVDSLDDTLYAIGDFLQLFDVIDNILEGVDVVLVMLSPIPVVGQIADSFEGLADSVTEALTELRSSFDELKKSVITPVTDVLDDVKKGLLDVKTVVTDISTTVPQYINTINVLSYLLDVAQPLTEVLEGTEPGKRLEAVVSELNKVKTDIGQALEPLRSGLATITTGVKYFADEVKKMVDDLGDDAKAAIQGLKDIGNNLSTIVSGFKKAENAIAPVRWVLDAVACLINKILMPVVHWIMEVTGLQALVDEAEKWVLQKLGVKPICDLTKKSVNADQIQSHQSNIGSKQGSAAVKAFQDLGEALGKYRNNKSEALKDATFGLVSAITGTPIDPNKPSHLPPWPSMPDLDGNNKTFMTNSVHVPPIEEGGALQKGFEEIEAIHSSQARSLSSRPVMLTLLLMEGPETEGPDLPAVDPSSWPKSAALISSIHSMTGDISKLSSDAQTLSTSLTKFQSSLQLPTAFNAQISDMATVLKTCDDTLRLLLGFKVDFIDSIVQPVQTVVEVQMKDVTQVTSAMPNLVQAIGAVGNASGEVINAIPQTAMVEITIHRLDGWVLAVQQLVAIMELGYEHNTAGGNKYTSELDAFKSQIEASAQELSVRLKTIDSQVTSASQSVESLQQGLDAYSEALTTLSSHSKAISTTAMPALHNVANIMGKIDSIFDPLSSLLEAENCVDSENLMKKGAAHAVSAIKTAGKTSATPPSNTLEEIAEKFGEKILPMGQIASSVNAATETISNTVVHAFNSQSSTLIQALQGLTDSLKQTKSYEIKNKDGSKSNLSNDIVDQDFVEQAKALIGKITGTNPVS